MAFCGNGTLARDRTVEFLMDNTNEMISMDLMTTHGLLAGNWECEVKQNASSKMSWTI